MCQLVVLVWCETEEETYNVLCGLGVLWSEGADKSHFGGFFVLLLCKVREDVDG